MPKNKSHSGANKRFRVTGSGKVMRQRGSRRHYLEHKPSKRTRRLHKDREVAPPERTRVRRMLRGRG